MCLEHKDRPNNAAPDVQLRKSPSPICLIPERQIMTRRITGYSPRLDCSALYAGRDGRCLGHERTGQRLNSNPVHPEADERMFVLLKSRLRHPDLLVGALHGWYAPENDEWRWTAKSFALEVVPPADGTPSEFALRFQVPAVAPGGTGSGASDLHYRGLSGGDSNLYEGRNTGISRPIPSPVHKARYPTRFQGGE